MWAGEKKARRAGDPLLLHDVGDRRLGDEGHGKENDHEDRFGEEADHAGPAGSHRTVGVSGIDRRECGEEAREAEEEPARQHVAHEGERQRIVRQDRDQNRDEDRHHEHQIGRDAKDPGGLVRYDLVFVEELPDIPIRLKDAGAAFALHDLLEPGEHAGVQGCERHTNKTCKAL